MGAPLPPVLADRIKNEGTKLSVGVDCSTCGALIVHDDVLVTFEYDDIVLGKLPVVNLSGFAELRFACACGEVVELDDMQEALRTTPGDPDWEPPQ